MELLIKYQLPTDLLASGIGGTRCGVGGAGARPTDTTPADGLEDVRNHVANLRALVTQAAAEELEEATKAAQFERVGQFAPQKQAQRDMRSDSSQDEPVVCVIDAGSSRVRAGIAGERAPRVVFPNVIGRPKHYGIMVGMCTKGGSGPSDSNAVVQPKMDSPPEPETTPDASPKPVTESEGEEDTSRERSLDYTQIPSELDRRFEALDEDGAVRPTILSAARLWKRRTCKSLLAPSVEQTLGADAQRREKHAAFDLLEALTRSGTLPVDHATLHVMVTATHCFSKTLEEVIVQGNVNPVDKVERSSLIMASTIYQKPVAALLRDDQRERVALASPALLDGG